MNMKLERSYAEVMYTHDDRFSQLKWAKFPDILTFIFLTLLNTQMA